jgi:hypothetical protein
MWWLPGWRCGCYGRASSSVAACQHLKKISYCTSCFQHLFILRTFVGIVGSSSHALPFMFWPLFLDSGQRCSRYCHEDNVTTPRGELGDGQDIIIPDLPFLELLSPF